MDEREKDFSSGGLPGAEICGLGAASTELAIGHAPARELRADIAARIDSVEPAILDAIRDGNFPVVAAQAQGVPVRTWYNWRGYADRGDERCTELFERVDCALAEAEMSLVAKLRNPPLDGLGKADQGYIRATQFLLERTRRERWGDKIEVKVKVEDSLREMMDELEQRMPPESFQDFVIAMSEIGSDDGDERH